jgi:hypothetical protein
VKVIDTAGGIIYDHHMFIVQATEMMPKVASTLGKISLYIMTLGIIKLIILHSNT